MLNRTLLITVVGLSLAPLPARAQFTAVIAPPKQEAPAPVAESPAKRDSLQATRLSDMRAWVDSAAASLGAGAPSAPSATAVPAARDSLPAPVVPPARAAVPSTPQGDLRSGARAPDTATPLPLLVVAGALLLAAGLAIKARDRA